MAGLPQAGVKLIAEGAGEFLSTMDRGSKAVTDFGGAAEKAGGGVSSFGQVAIGALREVGAMAVTVAAQGAKALAGFVGDSVKMAGDFDAGLRTLSAVAGDSMADAGVSLDSFREKALQLGADTIFSADEALTAMTELAKGGVPIADVMNTATAATLNLASAGGVELANAAEIVAKQLGVWGDAAGGATAVSDLLAQAANASVVGVDELALGLANAGGVAKIAGLSFEETVTTMAAISSGFSSASDAGTSLKTMLSRLQPATKPAAKAMAELGLLTAEGTSKFYDAQGGFIGMAKAAELLKSATSGLSEAQKIQALQTIFGQDAIRAAAILAEKGADGYNAMSLSMEKAGTAAAQAQKMNEGFNAVMQALGGSIDTVKIRIGTLLLPILASLVNSYLIPVINAVGDLVGAFEAFGKGDSFTAFSTLGQIIQPLNQRFGEFVVSLGLASDPLATIIASINAAVPGFSAFLGAVGAVGGALGNIGLALVPIVTGFGGASSGASILSAVLITATPILLAVAGGLNGMAGAIALLPNLWAVAGAATGSFAEQIGFVLDTLLGTQGTLQNLGQFISANLGPILAGLGGIIAAALLPSLASAAGAFGGIVLAAGSVVLPLVGVGLAAAALYQVWTQNLGGIQEKTAAVVGAISGVFGQLSGIVSSAIGAIVAGVQQSGPAIQSSLAAYQSIASTVSGVFSSILGMVSAVLGQVQGFITTYGAQAVATFMTTWSTIQTTVANLLGALASIVQPLLANIQQFIAEHGAEIQAFFAQTWQQVNTIIQTAMAIINATIVPILKGIGGFIASHGTEIQAILSNTWTAISTIISTVLSTIQGVLTATLQIIQGDWAGAWETIKNTCATIVEGIITVVQSGLGNLAAAFSMAMGDSLSAVLAFAADFASAGKAMVDGMISGVRSAAGKLASMAAKVASDALKAAKSALGISSPSAVAREEVGIPFVEGITAGIHQEAPQLHRTVTATLHEGVKQARAIVAKDAGGRSIGRDFVGGIAEGVKQSDGGGLKRGADQVSRDLTNAFKKALRINSPSDEAAEQIGSPFTRGIVKGLLKAQPDLFKALATTKEGMLKVFDDLGGKIGKTIQEALGAAAEMARDRGNTLAGILSVADPGDVATGRQAIESAEQSRSDAQDDLIAEQAALGTRLNEIAQEVVAQQREAQANMQQIQQRGNERRLKLAEDLAAKQRQLAELEDDRHDQLTKAQAAETKRGVLDRVAYEKRAAQINEEFAERRARIEEQIIAARKDAAADQQAIANDQRAAQQALLGLEGERRRLVTEAQTASDAKQAEIAQRILTLTTQIAEAKRKQAKAESLLQHKRNLQLDARGAIEEANRNAQQMTDPRQRAAFLRLRQNQIKELLDARVAVIEAQMADPTDAISYQQQVEATETQLRAIQEAQEAERAAFQAGLLTSADESGKAIGDGITQAVLASLGTIGEQFASVLSQALGGVRIEPRALGGPVNASQPYLVGERGPELFVPQRAGRIEPLARPSQMARMAGGGNTYGGATYNLNVTSQQSVGSIRAEFGLMRVLAGA